jgi:hypothetical protein
MRNVFAAMLVLFLVSRGVNDGVMIRVLEKYGPTWVIDSVNIVALSDGMWYVTRAGHLYAAYPSSNYGIEVEPWAPRTK